MNIAYCHAATDRYGSKVIPIGDDDSNDFPVGAYVAVMSVSDLIELCGGDSANLPKEESE